VNVLSPTANTAGRLLHLLEHGVVSPRWRRTEKSAAFCLLDYLATLEGNVSKTAACAASSGT
jgi:hypothetical protein